MNSLTLFFLPSQLHLFFLLTSSAYLPVHTGVHESSLPGVIIIWVARPFPVDFLDLAVARVSLPERHKPSLRGKRGGVIVLEMGGQWLGGHLLFEATAPLYCCVLRVDLTVCGCPKTQPVLVQREAVRGRGDLEGLGNRSGPDYNPAPARRCFYLPPRAQLGWTHSSDKVHEN